MGGRPGKETAHPKGNNKMDDNKKQKESPNQSSRLVALLLRVEIPGLAVVRIHAREVQSQTRSQAMVRHLPEHRRHSRR